MKLSYIIVLALALLCAAVLSQEQPAPQNNPPPYANDPEQQPPTALPIDPEQSATPIPVSSSSNSEREDPSSTETMCIMVAIECPNNTWNIASANCELVCGALPIGGLSWEQTNAVMQDFETFYGSKISGSYISTISAHGQNVQIQTPPESYSDYCIEVFLLPNQEFLPDVFNGVRVFYSVQYTPGCSPIFCADGTVRSCEESCDTPQSRGGHFLFTPMTVILFVVILSACCCARRRRCRAKCNMNAHATPAPVATDSNYPAQNYHLLNNSGAEAHRDTAIDVDYPVYPMAMPPPPPMMPNGMYPIMMQAPNGTWFPVIPQPPHQA